MRGVFCNAKDDKFAKLLYESFRLGFKKHGDTLYPVNKLSRNKNFVKADFFVIIGYCISTHFRKFCINEANKKKAPIIHVDAAPTNIKKASVGPSYGQPHHYLSIGLNNIKGLGQFNIDDITDKDCDRWNKISCNCNLEIRPWKKDGKRVLVLGHNLYGLSVGKLSVNRQVKEIRQTIKKLEEFFNKEVIYRPHPSLEKINPKLYKEVKDTLDENLDNTYCSVGWHTNAQVHSIINGIPCIYLSDLSMLDTSVAVKRIEDELIYPDRQLWLNRLSYSQWNYDEILSGEGLERMRELIK